MRLSIIRLGETFVKERQYALPQKGAFTRNAFKISLANTGIIMVLTCALFLFGVPTPDIRHDLRCMINSDFNQYSQSKRKVYLEYADQRLARSYRFHEGRIQRQSFYGPHNEDIFKHQDYE